MSHNFKVLWNQLSASFGIGKRWNGRGSQKATTTANKLIEQPDPASMATITAKALTAQRAAEKERRDSQSQQGGKE